MPDNIERIYSSLVPEDMKDELYWKDGLNPEDDRLWVPIGPGRWSRPLCLNVSQGYWVHFIKVTEPGIISRHRHPAPVHAPAPAYILHMCHAMPCNAPCHVM